MKSQSGNVLFIIFIAVGLFGGLSYALMQGSKGVAGSGREEAILAAGQLGQYAASLRQGVRRVRLMADCRDNQISFERSPFDGSDTDYYNPNSPTDKSCHIFHTRGGQVTYQELPKGLNDGSDYFFPRNLCIPDVGTGSAVDHSVNTCNQASTSELVMIVPYISLEACLYYNRNNNIPAINGLPPRDHGGSWDLPVPAFFRGSFTAGYQITDRSGNGSFNGKLYGCFEGGGDPPAGSYHFYYVLLAR